MSPWTADVVQVQISQLFSVLFCWYKELFSPSSPWKLFLEMLAVNARLNCQAPSWEPCTLCSTLPSTLDICRGHTWLKRRKNEPEIIEAAIQATDSFCPLPVLWNVCSASRIQSRSVIVSTAPLHSSTYNPVWATPALALTSHFPCTTLCLSVPSFTPPRWTRSHPPLILERQSKLPLSLPLATHSTELAAPLVSFLLSTGGSHFLPSREAILPPDRLLGLYTQLLKKRDNL